MPNVSLVLDQRKARKDGSYPLVIRVTYLKKRVDVATHVHLKSYQFNSKTENVIGDKVLNLRVKEQKEVIKARMLDLLTKHPSKPSFDEFKAGILQQDEVKPSSEPVLPTVSEFWLQQVKILTESGRAGGASNYLRTLEVVGKIIELDVPFTEITTKTLLFIEHALLSRGAKVNTVAVYMRTLRAVYNKAILADVVSSNDYPFKKYKIKKESTIPRPLQLNELRRYFSLSFEPTHHLYNTHLLGKLMFMLRGINLKDLVCLSSENFKDGRIIYKRFKTSKIYSIKLTSEIEEVFRQLPQDFTQLSGVSSTTGLRIDLSVEHKYKLKRQLINIHLGKIGKLLGYKQPLTTYVFRYSYANIAKQLGFSKDLIAEALGHEYGNSVTGIYLELFDNSVLDDMNERIIEAVLRRVD